MFSLGFIGGSKSASGFGPGGPYPLADSDRGVKSAGTPVISPRESFCDVIYPCYKLARELNLGL